MKPKYPRLVRLRRILKPYPSVAEKQSHGAPCFFVGGKTALCYFHAYHRGNERISVWCPVLLGTGDVLVLADPQIYFQPQTSSSGAFRDWIGMYVDTEPELSTPWAEIADHLDVAYHLVAPKHLHSNNPINCHSKKPNK